MSPLNISWPLGESLWMATLCGTPASLLSNSIEHGVLAALSWMVGPAAWPPLGAGWPLAPGAALGAGAGVALALAIASASQASKSDGDSAWTSNSMIRW